MDPKTYEIQPLITQLPPVQLPLIPQVSTLGLFHYSYDDTDSCRMINFI